MWGLEEVECNKIKVLWEGKERHGGSTHLKFRESGENQLSAISGSTQCLVSAKLSSARHAGGTSAPPLTAPKIQPSPVRGREQPQLDAVASSHSWEGESQDLSE